ncbi:MAG: cytochrome c oxidase subunit 3 family protein [Acidobacteriota bacterium]|nr:cytochrome c oxidase subunit 3 family protein [Acidobacteriota bacterium]
MAELEPLRLEEHAPSTLQHHFRTMDQQRDASSLAMWVFLVTEILFFGAFFLTYMIYRWQYSRGFAHASLHMDVMLGTTNTAVLIVSSLTMAMAVHSAATGRRRLLLGFLSATIVLGFAFLGIKAVEYADHIRHHLLPGPGFRYPGPDGPAAQMFFSLYFGMTGLHALHMIVGIGIMTTLLVMSYRGRFSPEYYTPVEVSGLYWHFVDIVWIFLFPLLYLIGRHLK